LDRSTYSGRQAQKLDIAKKRVSDTGDHNLTDSETFYVGDLKIEVLSTPGHTDDNLCFVIYERLHSNTPLFVFTGDTLLADDVGRTDLLGTEETTSQSKKLYRSIFEGFYR
jgi:hydroxyacylglutathione hydrolase